MQRLLKYGIEFREGRHDFRIFKESRLRIAEKTAVRADSGYPGIAEMHKNSLQSKKNPLSMKDRRNNKNLSYQRFFTSMLSAKSKFLKYFQIDTGRKIFELRFKLIAGSYTNSPLI